MIKETGKHFLITYYDKYGKIHEGIVAECKTNRAKVYKPHWIDGFVYMSGRNINIIQEVKVKQFNI